MENPKLEDMGSGNLNSIYEASELEGKEAQKISVAHQQMNGLEYTGHKADSFIVDIERFSPHLTDKNIHSNSRIALKRSLSRKGSQRGSEKKTISSISSERDNTTTIATSPKAVALHGKSEPAKPMVVAVGATDHSHSPQVHNAITIMAGSGGATAAESKTVSRRFSFRRSSPSWTIDPRRILFFFASISSMGTILLIYFTLSTSKLSADDNGLN